MTRLFTTLGLKSVDEVGMILPHEHIFVDLRTIDQQDATHVEASDVITLMAPELEKIKTLGVTALVECTPVGVNRRVDFVKAVSEASQFPILVPTGTYREPFIPKWAMAASEEEMRDWMLKELQEGIENTGVQAAWIKLSAGDDGITECESKILRAAAKAGIATNAIIGSHTIRGRVVKDQLDIIEAAGYNPERFIWIHTQNEPDLNLHREIAHRGAWIEYDSIGGERFSDEFFLQRIQEVLEAGLGEHLLLSHDRGWFDPAKSGGGVPKSFSYINEMFFDKLRASGIDATAIKQLTHTNPFRAFAR